LRQEYLEHVRYLLAFLLGQTFHLPMELYLQTQQLVLALVQLLVPHLLRQRLLLDHG
jgi:hypothetical protein